MAGEMAWINQDGTDSNGDNWPLHAAIARALEGELFPFDVYQGPYVRALGHKFWIVPDDDWPDVLCRVYDATSHALSEPFEYQRLEDAVEAALGLLLITPA